jgi:4-amino-4-deoxy-L-arabinose transferase-like glycosyltransferase
MNVNAGVGRWTPRWLSPLTLIVGFVSLCAVHAPLIGYKAFANVDEAYASALAERLLEGFKLYDGAVSQRGPLMYYAFEGLAWLHGWDNIVALRVWALAFCLSHLFLVYWIARVSLSREAAITAAGVTAYALVFGFPAFDGYALHGETLQLPALLGGVLLGVSAVRMPPGSNSRRRRLIAAGLLFGAASSIKQSVILHPAVLVVWLLIDAHRRKARWSTFTVDVAMLGVATLLLPAAFLVHAAHEGTLRQLIYYCYTYNRDVHLRPSTRWWLWLPNFFFRLSDSTTFFFLLFALASLGATRIGLRIRSAWRERSLWPLGRGFGVRHYFALNLVVAVASGAMMYRFFPHYFLQAMPFAALCAGSAVEPYARSRRWRSAWSALTVGLAAFVLLCGWLGTVFGERVDGRVMHDRTVDDVSKLIAGTTSPSDRIFVWGFSPWIYQYSHRRPAGRYVFETYVTGVVPWFWEKLSVERARIVPGSVDALLGDLDREKPAVVVDAGSIMLARPMRMYPRFADWLHANYCFDVRIGALDVYRRVADGAACEFRYFPRPFGAIDWGGRGLPLPMPKLADENMTRPLPHGNFFKPIWFGGEPTPRGLSALQDARRDREEKEADAEGFRIERTEFDWTADR